MSGYISGAVWASGPKNHNQRYVLLAIADNANDQGCCWPSVETIVEKCLISKSTVLRCLSVLESEGWVIIDRKSVEHKGSSYQIVLEKLAFDRPKSGVRVKPDKKSQVSLTMKSGVIDDITIRKNRQEPSLFPAPPSQDDGQKNGTGKKKAKVNGVDPRHQPCKDLIFRCYRYINDGEDPPWGPADAKQLSSVLKETPKLEEAEFAYWLKYYAQSENINSADRPAKFLPKIHSFANGPLDKFGRLLEKQRVSS